MTNYQLSLLLLLSSILILLLWLLLLLLLLLLLYWTLLLFMSFLSPCAIRARSSGSSWVSWRRFWAASPLAWSWLQQDLRSWRVTSFPSLGGKNGDMSIPGSRYVEMIWNDHMDEFPLHLLEGGFWGFQKMGGNHEHLDRTTGNRWTDVMTKCFEISAPQAGASPPAACSASSRSLSLLKKSEIGRFVFLARIILWG